MSTGKFNNEMRTFFEAESGAYTTFTEVELKKQTYNVKAAIRNVIIEGFGKENVPRAGSGDNQTLTFHVCKKGELFHGDYIKVPCKFSKPDKDEMTIYFRRKITEYFQQGDFWYVYIGTDKNVYLGIMHKQLWDAHFNNKKVDQDFEPEDSYKQKLNAFKYSGTEHYKIAECEDAPNIALNNNKAPGSIQKAASPDENADNAYNKKVIGDRGEQIVIEIEKQRIKDDLKREDLISRISHDAKDYDGLGYDIRSVDIIDGEEVPIFIEVKTTTGGKNKPFHISQNELEASKRFKRFYYIYRVYNLNDVTNDYSFYRINGPMDEECKLLPADYIAYPGKEE